MALLLQGLSFNLGGGGRGVGRREGVRIAKKRYVRIQD
jgi:hypothetical protein